MTEKKANQALNGTSGQAEAKYRKILARYPEVSRRELESEPAPAQCFGRMTIYDVTVPH